METSVRCRSSPRPTTTSLSTDAAWRGRRLCAITRLKSRRLAERERKQTGTQQHEAGCGQREESVGHKIMSTHDAPVALDAVPDSSKVSESVLFERTCGFAEGQALERKPSKAWARKMPTLTRPRNAVTVSNIATSFCAPAGTERPPRCTVKRIPKRSIARLDIRT